MIARTTVLVADHGVAACRIVRTCRDMGLRSVVLATEHDSLACHTRMADEVVNLPGTLPNQTFQNHEKVLAAAKAVNATIVHPGSGVLASDEGFRAACDAAGLIFVGPTGLQMQRLAHRPDAVQAMAAAGVASLPDPHDHADFPLSRHVEVQFIADSLGGVVHLGTRACSIRSGNRRLIEEAPAPWLDPIQIESLVGSTLKAVVTLGCCGAGSAEYLLDHELHPHFVALRTRLQTGYAATEVVYGVDLVQAQIRVALLEPLPWQQKDLVPRGFATICAVRCVNPHSDFAVSSGRPFRYRTPSGPFVRLDSSLEEGGEFVPVHDTLIAHVTTAGRTRPESISRMHRAVDEFELEGVSHNLPLIRRVLGRLEFADGTYDSGLVARLGPLPSGAAAAGVRFPVTRSSNNLVAPALHGTNAGDVSSRMAGRVVRIFVAPGQKVVRGQPLLVLEAMKMENEIKSPADGTVIEILAREGDRLDRDALMMRLG